MNTPLFIVSDNHFQNINTTFENERRKRFYSLLDYIQSKKGTLIIAGDFFDFWFTYNGYVPIHYVEILEKLKNLKEEGVKIYYVLGNHDYWEFGFFNNIFAEKTFKDKFFLKKDNKNCMIVHGDGLLKKDCNYRLFRTIIRSKICIYFFNLLPPHFGYWIAEQPVKSWLH